MIAYKDRLSRFGFDLIEDLIHEYSGGKIIIMEEKDDMEPEEELVRDVLQIMNVFTAKMNGLRKYRKNGNYISSSISEKKETKSNEHVRIDTKN